MPESEAFLMSNASSNVHFKYGVVFELEKKYTVL